jgi:hypothetical protein
MAVHIVSMAVHIVSMAVHIVSMAVHIVSMAVANPARDMQQGPAVGESQKMKVGVFVTHFFQISTLASTC